MQREWHISGARIGLAGVLLAVGVLTGCRGLTTSYQLGPLFNVQYQRGWTGFESVAELVRKQAIRPDLREEYSANLQLACIEFDDQGEMFTPEQAFAAARELQTCARRPILLVFAHGWKHNAHQRDGNLAKFVDLANRVARDYPLSDVRAVYIGWRGASVPPCLSGFPGLLTFWSRKPAAARVGGVTLTSALAALYDSAMSAKTNRVTSSAELAARPAAERAIGDEAVVVFLGHSFGSAVMEDAVGKLVVARQGMSPPFRPVMILANSANDSLTARRVMQTLPTASSQPESHPYIFHVTGTKDWYTNSVFTLGQLLLVLPARALAGEWKWREKEFVDLTRTPGHSNRFISHTLDVCKGVAPATVGQDRDPGAAELYRSAAAAKPQPQELGPGESVADPFPLRPREAGAPSLVGTLRLATSNPAYRTPSYWVISADSGEVIENHNDVWSLPMQDVARFLIHYSKTQEKALVQRLQSKPEAPTR